MDRRSFILSFTALGLARPAFAAQLSLGAISSYLNSIGSAKATFTQVNDDGTLSTGTLYIKRPGRLRFEYDPPQDLLVMAGGGQIGIFDGKTNRRKAERYPLSETPLNIILERNVDLSRRNMVVGHSFDGTATTVVAQDPAHPEYGNIALKFTDNPVELRQWIVTDGQGAKTTVILGGLRPGGDLSSFLFNISNEEKKRYGG